ncbi:MAG TPA: permease-like cell division protein FtsX [Solirubrobacteraceae bacterium]|jgi:cell division transport system permease protein|nr:permease-like cell division protein FtsX [Solirubrobacteraceae bacterium]
MKLGFFLRETLRTMRRNAVPSFAAMASVLVTMLVLGVFIPIVQATTGAANEIRSRVLVDVYLKSTARPDDIARVNFLLTHNTPHVKHVQFVSKQQAYLEQRKNNPEAYALLGSNPLPDTFRITPDKADNVVAIKNELTSSGGAFRDAAIDQVRDQKDQTQKILSATRVVKLTVAILAALLIIASVLLISNTIRLSVFARRREIEVMKLVGATDWFIRWPFVIEGLVLGATGGALAVLMLAIGKIALIDPLTHDFSLIAAPSTINFGLLIAVLMAASVAVASAGSGISLRRFLRV